MWQFLLGLFVGSFVAVTAYAIVTVANKAERYAEYDFKTKINKKEETHDDGQPVSEVGFEDF